MQNLSFRKYSAFLGMLLCSLGAYAQEPLSVIDSMRVPASPAFKIIGTEPTSVERPTDLKALAIDLSTIGASGGALPAQFAMEFGIAKLFSSGRKGLFDYYFPSIGQTIIDNLSLSLATGAIPADMFVDSSFHASSAWSFGIRTHILGGGYDIDRASFKQAIRNRISLTDNVDRFLKYTILEILDDTASRKQLLSLIASGAFSSATPSAATTILFDNGFGKVMYKYPALVAQADVQDIATIKTAASQFFLTFVNANTTVLNSLTPTSGPAFLATYNEWSATNILNSPTAVYSAQKLAKMLAVKSGHYLEVAAAGAGAARNDKIDAFSLKRYSAWVTYSYRPGSADDWEGSAMLRMISNQADSSTQIATYDIGCRASCPRLWPAAVSFEGIVRLSPEYKPDFRIAVIGEYPLTDNFYLTATFGRGFDMQTVEASNLLSVLGVKFGLGSDKLVLTDDDLK